MSKKLKQLSLIAPPSLEHGGEKRRGKRKIARPFDPKRSLHVVLKATRARGEFSMLHGRRRERVEHLTRDMAKRFEVTIDRQGYANVGNHIHLIVRAKLRVDLQNFLRTLSGALAVLVAGVKRGCALGIRFWDELVYSRVVNWGRDLANVRSYLLKNLRQVSTVFLRESVNVTNSVKVSDAEDVERFLVDAHSHRL